MALPPREDGRAHHRQQDRDRRLDGRGVSAHHAVPARSSPTCGSSGTGCDRARRPDAPETPPSRWPPTPLEILDRYLPFIAVGAMVVTFLLLPQPFAIALIGLVWLGATRVTSNHKFLGDDADRGPRLVGDDRHRDPGAGARALRARRLGRLIRAAGSAASSGGDTGEPAPQWWWPDWRWTIWASWTSRFHATSASPWTNARKSHIVIDVGVEVRLRGHGRRPDAIRDQGDRSEVIAGSELADVLVVDRDGGRPVGDDEEADPAVVALAHDDGACGERPLGELLRQLLEVLPVQTGQHRDRRKGVDDIRSACADASYRDRNVNGGLR